LFREIAPLIPETTKFRRGFSSKLGAQKKLIKHIKKLNSKNSWKNIFESQTDCV
jgi:hypothetical protein